MPGVDQLLQSFGYVVIFAFVFIESGIILGLAIPLPGLSLLFTAGIFAASGRMSLAAILFIGAIAAFTGYMVGYLTGARFGHKLYGGKNAKYFTRENMQKAENFFNKRKASALILGRWVPFVHTAAPIMAGVAKMPYRRFLVYNIIGAIAWTLTGTLSGYYIGSAFPDAEKYLVVGVISLIIIANVPPVRRLAIKIGIKIKRKIISLQN